MRIVVQRVSEAAVRVNHQITGQIDSGLLVFVGFEAADTEEDIAWITGKLVNLRIFNDEQAVMNKSCLEVGGDILLVSQFTLHASTKKGNRPSYIRAARPEQAIPLYESMIAVLSNALGKPVATGVFGADMKVSLLNDGPVTILIDSKHKE
jgi:D-tyrosyl-tRNA(Tyr) deacylase